MILSNFVKFGHSVSCCGPIYQYSKICNNLRSDKDMVLKFCIMNVGSRCKKWYYKHFHVSIRLENFIFFRESLPIHIITLSPVYSRGRSFRAVYTLIHKSHTRLEYSPRCHSLKITAWEIQKSNNTNSCITLNKAEMLLSCNLYRPKCVLVTHE